MLEATRLTTNLRFIDARVWYYSVYVDIETNPNYSRQHRSKERKYWVAAAGESSWMGSTWLEINNKVFEKIPTIFAKEPSKKCTHSFINCQQIKQNIVTPHFITCHKTNKQQDLIVSIYRSSALAATGNKSLSSNLPFVIWERECTLRNSNLSFPKVASSY